MTLGKGPKLESNHLLFIYLSVLYDQKYMSLINKLHLKLKCNKIIHYSFHDSLYA